MKKIAEKIGVTLFLLCITTGGTLQAKDVRKSILAGTWYPGSPGELRKAVGNYLAEATPPIPSIPGGKLKAIIVPHAGYQYSGPVAAYAYRLLEKRKFRRVILVGPSHRFAFRGISANLQSGYETPLGVCPVDRDFARKLLDASPKISWVPSAHAYEHCLEIQLPFLQTVLQDFKIVPIIMGEQDFSTCTLLANILARVIDHPEQTLLLASTDLSHYHRAKEARLLDMEFIKHVRNFDPEGLASSLAMGSCEACGGGPAVATMLAARKLGANSSIVLHYANSGDVTGDYRRVVGYVSAALFKKEEQPTASGKGQCQ